MCQNEYCPINYGDCPDCEHWEESRCNYTHECDLKDEDEEDDLGNVLMMALMF